MKRWILPFIVIVVISGIIIYNNWQKNSGIYYGDYRECVESRIKAGGEYEKDVVIVRFKSETNFTAAILSLQSMNLTFDVNSEEEFVQNGRFIKIKTDQGKEFYVVCKLNDEDIVTLAYRPMIGRVEP